MSARIKRDKKREDREREREAICSNVKGANYFFRQKSNNIQEINKRKLFKKYVSILHVIK